MAEHSFGMTLEYGDSSDLTADWTKLWNSPTSEPWR